MVGWQTLESWKMPRVAGMWGCKLFHALLVAEQSAFLESSLTLHRQIISGYMHSLGPSKSTRVDIPNK